MTTLLIPLGLALVAIGLTLACRRAYRHLCRVRFLTALATHSKPVNAGPIRISPGIKVDRVVIAANPDGSYTTTIEGHFEDDEP